MIHQNSARFYESVIYDREFTGLADSFEEGQRISNHFLKKQNLTKRVLTQQHHGVFVIGPSASCALDDTYFFEKACKLQVELIKIGDDPKACVMSEAGAKNVF